MRRSISTACLRFLLTLALVGFVLVPTTRAQTPRVQFIHASPYAEAAVFDVYRNGELWLDDFAFSGATPFTDWPDARRFQLDFTHADATDGNNPFFSETITLVPGERYYVVVTGDPLNKPEQLPFKLFVRDKARETSLFNELTAYLVFQHNIGYAGAPFVRGFLGTTGTEHVAEHHYKNYGWSLPDYNPAPPFIFEVDMRTPDKELIYSTIDDRRGMQGLAIVIVDVGFLRPSRPGDAGPTAFTVVPDGRVQHQPLNVARVQFIHNAPYLEADTVDVSVTRLDAIGTDQKVLHLDNLAFREASPFMALPSGRFTAGKDLSAPELVIDVTTPGGADTLYTEHLWLQYGETYVAMLTGDPLERTDQPPMDLHLKQGWREQATEPGTIDVLFAQGVPDMLGASIGVEGEAGPLAGLVMYGDFHEALALPLSNDAITLTRAETQEMLARVDPQLLTRDLADSALVVLTSGFVDPPVGLAATNSELALVAALPSGGPLLRFTMRPPPLQPFWYVVGLFALALAALVGYQVRLWRLRAHTRELNTLVEERTRELQAEKQKTEEQAKRLLELDEAKNRFFANISHEFRTPLTLILGPLQDALDHIYGEIKPARFAKQLGPMHRSARRLLRLIIQLLDLSRLESGKLELHPEPGDLHAFTCDLIRSFVPLAERRRLTLHFHTDTDTDTLPLAFDPDAIEKVVTNLVSNALKFTPEGGEVLVTLKKGSSYATVSVKDTGPGIAEEDLNRIFDRFQQADTSIRRKYEGSGVGLTLAKELAELHGGTLEVESEVDFGSTFTVRLPLPETPPVLVAAEATNGQPDAPLLEAAAFKITNGQPAALPEGERPTVLIVEDNPDVRAYLRDHLEDDYNLLEAEDGEVGLELAQAHTPDLVLADVMMPKMDGYELCRLLKANDTLRHIPVVMLTAKAAERDTVEGLESGADDYLSKPFSVTELKARLSNLLTSRREMREKYSREVVVRPADITITPEEEVFLDRVLEIINEHLGDANFTVDWLADEVGLSRRQLERKIEAVTGETPSALIRRLRLERASQLLRARAGTVAEVAYAVGFRSPSHFSGVFRTAYGISPTEHIENGNREEKV